jgi:Predicted membrane protein (DUF2254)
VAGRLSFRWRQIAHDLRTGLLFRPVLITAMLALLAFGLVELERRGSITPFRDGGWFFRNDPGSAQTVLGAIGGSMMSVISIVYSVMLVALSLASVQFSPRILGAFVRDKVSQRTLGIFIGTFVYCLIVMRSVSADPPWVATWATVAGMVLGLMCLLALIYFIHHIATGIQVTNIVNRIGIETEEVIEDVYPVVQPLAAPPRAEGAASVVAPRAGYLQLVDYEGLANLARIHRILIHVTPEPGDYVPRKSELARLCGSDVPAAAAKACTAAFDVGPMRTMQQDVGFGIRQLVDIALKAISPAVNDPRRSASTGWARYLPTLAAARPDRGSSLTERKRSWSCRNLHLPRWSTSRSTSCASTAVATSQFRSGWSLPSSVRPVARRRKVASTCCIMPSYSRLACRLRFFPLIVRTSMLPSPRCVPSTPRRRREPHGSAPARNTCSSASAPCGVRVLQPALGQAKARRSMERA